MNRDNISAVIKHIARLKPHQFSATDLNRNVFGHAYQLATGFCLPADFLNGPFWIMNRYVMEAMQWLDYYDMRLFLDSSVNRFHAIKQLESILETGSHIEKAEANAEG